MKNKLNVYTTRNGNDYLISKQNQRVFVFHPLIRIINELVRLDNKNIENYLLNGYNSREYGFIEAPEFRYYYLKYEYYINMHIIDSVDQKSDDRDLYILTETDVKFFYALSDNIVFEVTDRCNLNCTYCAYGQLYCGFDERLRQDLSFEKAVLIINHYLENKRNVFGGRNKFRFTVGFYGGEPLLNFGFIKEVVDYCNLLEDAEVKYIMTTNGLLLNKYVEFFVNNDFQLLLSLDGDKYCNSYRLFQNNKASFDVVYRNISIVKSLYPKYFIDNVAINSVLHNRNSVKTTTEYIYKHFGKYPLITPLSIDGIIPNKKNKFDKMYNSGIAEFDKLKHCSNKIFSNSFFVAQSPDFSDFSFFYRTCSGNYYNDNSDLVKDVVLSKRLVSNTCMPFSKRIFVTVNGKILPCESIHHKHFLGFISDDYITLDFKQIAEKYNQEFRNVSSSCKKCGFGEDCPTCVFKLEGACENIISKASYRKHIERLLSNYEDFAGEFNKILNENID